MTHHRYSPTIRRVARYIADATPYATELLRSLSYLERMHGESGAEENFDLGRALYWHASANHAGQSCAWYAVLSILDYNPASTERGDNSTYTDALVAYSADTYHAWDCDSDARVEP